MILSKWLTGFTETLTRSRHGNGRWHRHRRRSQVQEVLRPSDLARRVDALEVRTLLAANIAPVNVVPGSQSVLVNTPLGFTEFRENQISTGDADAGLNPVVVTLTAEHGLLTLNHPDPNGGLTYSVGDGTSDSTMTFSGKLTDINEALTWVVFQPEADYVGTEASLTITTNDQGYLGTGGPKEDTDTIIIDVTAVPSFDDSPTWTTFPGDLDTSFGADGKQTLSVSAGTDYIRQMKLLPDGRILAVGAVNNRFGLMRFNSDLTLDTSFGTDGVTESNFGDGQIAWEVIDHPGGGYLVSGTSRIARYTVDGQLDSSFGTDGVVINDHLNVGNSMDITADGKLVVGGHNSDDYRVSFYTLDGLFLTNWNINQGELYRGRQRMRGVHTREDGDLVLLGNQRHELGYRSVRTNFAGSVEYRGTLNDIGNFQYIETSLELPDGKYLIVGRVNDQFFPDPISDDAYIGRWNADGSPDTSFGTNGAVVVPMLNVGFRPMLQPDGKIVVVGYAHNGSNYDFAAIRMSYDGVLDTSFDSDGALSIPFSGSEDYAHAAVMQPDGRIVIAGRTGDEIALVRLFGDNDQSSVSVNIAPVNVVPGSQTVQVNTPLGFTEFRENRISTGDADAGLNPVVVTLTAEHGLLTLNHPDPNGGLTYSVGDGTSDSTMTFSGKLTDINEALTWVVFQPEADYVGTEASLTITTNDQGYLGTGGPKEDTDTIIIDVTAVPSFDDSPTWTTFPGDLDTSFGADGKQTLSVSAGTDYIRQMKLLPDGRILAVGAVNNRFGLMRFNSDLTLDTSFGTDGVTESNFGDGQIAWEVIDHPGGGYLVSGTSRIARYTVDGQLDSSFGTDGVVINDHLNVGNSMDITADGKLVVGGHNSDDYRVSFYTLDGLFLTNWNINQGELYRGRQRMRGVHTREDGDLVLLGNQRHELGYRSVRTNFAGSVEYRGTLNDIGQIQYIETSLELPDGKYLIVGRVNDQSHVDRISDDAYIGRWNADGSPDTSFGTNGAVVVPMLNVGFRPMLQPDGKIVVVGYAHNGSNYDLAAIRMSYDGVLDTSFDSDGALSIPFSGGEDYSYKAMGGPSMAVVMQPDGKIVIAGRTGNEIALVRLFGGSDVLDEGTSDPTLEPINDRRMDEDAPPTIVNLTGITAGYAEQQAVRVTAISSDTGVIANPVVTYASPDKTGALTLTPVADVNGVATITVTVEDAGDDEDFATTTDNRSTERTFDVTVNAVNDTPTLDALSNLSIAEDAAQQTVNLAGISAGSGESQPLRVTASSSNTGLIPNPAVTYTTANATGSIVFTPVADQSGTATVTVTVEDGGLDNNLSTAGDNATFSRTFDVTVNPGNDDPTLNALSNVSIAEDAAQQTVNLAGITAGGGESQPLQVTSTSSNTSLILHPTVTYTSANATGSIAFTPVADQSGTATITVTVEDGGLDGDLDTAGDNATFSRTFDVTVNAVNDTPTLHVSETRLAATHGLKYLWIDANSAGSTSRIDDIVLTDLATGQTVYANDFSSNSTEGLQLWFKADGIQPWQHDSTKTRIENGQLRLETTGFGQNGSGGYRSESGMTLLNELPEDFALSFRLTRLQWAGHSRIYFYKNRPDSATTKTEWDLTAGTKFEGSWAHDLFTVNPATVMNEISVNAVNNPVHVRFVKNGSTLEYYINDTLIESVAPLGLRGQSEMPTDDPLRHVTVAEDAAEVSLELREISAGGGESQPLRVTASSSNTGLIPNPSVTYTSANATGSIAFTPVTDQSGTATITVTVEDGGLDGNLSTAGDNATFSRTFDVTVNPLDDFGDAPAPYPTTLAEDGARHSDVGPRLGATRDEESDGLHSAAADADGSDEDGVVDTGGHLLIGISGNSLTVNVQNASNGAKLDAWMDFNQDGDWDDAEEQILVNTSVVNGNNTLTFDVPGSAVSGTTYARLRLSTAGGLAVTGAAPDGEVEDYEVEIDTVAPGVVISPSGILTSDEQITFTFQFSEPVDSFTGSDITLTNATAGTFTAVDSDTFTLVVTPVQSGTVTAAIDSGVTQDAARNNNSSSSASILSLGPASLTLSSGSEYEVLIDGSELVVQIQGGAEQFRQVTASISVLNISGSTGDDIVTVLNSGGVVSTPIEFTGENGNDQFDASQASGAVMLDGGAGNDTLSGGAGNDTIQAGSEDDLVSGGAGSNVLSGGLGTDTLLVSGNRTLRITASAASGAGQNSHSEFEQATLAGGPGNNRLDASAAAFPVTLLGAAGNDTLLSGSSADRLDGGDGIDMAEITGTNIVLTDASAPGSAGDTVVSIEGVLLTASARGSVINASGYTLGSVMIVGSSGNDTLTGGAGNDMIMAGGGSDVVNGGSGNDLIMGGGGRDNLSGDGGSDTIRGGRGRDTIDGGSESDVLAGGGGSDLIGGGDGNDWLCGESGMDYLDGGADDDTAFGNAGRDTMIGGQGIDNLAGQQSVADVIRLTGEATDDIFTLSRADNFIQLRKTTGATYGVNFKQTEAIELHTLDGNDTITVTQDLLGSDGNASIIVDFGNGNNSLDASLNTDAGKSFVVTAGTGNDTLKGSAGADNLNGGSGDDSIDGGAADDTLIAGTGNDTAHGNEGDDSILGEDGQDLLYGDNGDDIITGGKGNDSIDGGSNDDTVLGDRGLDIIKGGDGNDSLVGGDHPDIIDGGNGNDTVNGSSGDDVLLGGTANDTLLGNSGADTLIGGTGADDINGQGPSGDRLVGETALAGPGDDAPDAGDTFDAVSDIDNAFVLDTAILDQLNAF